ncbi:MAG TPA: glycogen debranching N-terminal domain-containing protein [Candidatus Limnocylindria bacterium]|nr:glycogen debranching N-terminal domain-containing protein [Candidatus Limnocylindria bacterium]
MEPATTELSVSIVEHTSFAVSDRAGDIHPGSYHGYFVADTRFLSRFVLRLDGKRLDPLASGGDEHLGARTFYLANRRLPGARAWTITVFRDRSVGPHLTERIRLISYNMEPVTVEVGVEVSVDFADIFEVRGRRRLTRHVVAHRRARAMRFAYDHEGYRRATTVAFDRPVQVHEDRAFVKARLEHGRPWDLTIRVEPTVAHRRGTPPPGRPHRVHPGHVRDWQAALPEIHTTDGRLTRAWRRAQRDMASLLLTAPARSFIPAAGLPWFLAIFGRDSAITAMESMILGPTIPVGTLRQLAVFQGRQADAWREEEPGKIPHEVRSGELATLGSVPFGRYYGSVDATPLYLMLFAEVARRSGWLTAGRTTAPPRKLAALMPHAEAALGWIDGRADGDGLIWYGPPGRGGIRNQAWKDSPDSMRFADGALADAPIAAVEVQGYVVAARRGMADVLDGLGRADEANAQRKAADRLAGAIDERFWMPAEGTYALGLDAEGRQIDGVGSNAGHLIWADAISPERAASVCSRLMAADMFTGWGIRTLSSRNPGYNPVGYHTGSVWPHDTSLIAVGLARAGMRDAAQVLFDALLDAAEADADARLPELFAGFDRLATPDLVPYPTACAPQAWATGAIFAGAAVINAIPPDERRPQWRSLTIDGLQEGWSVE